MVKKTQKLVNVVCERPLEPYMYKVAVIEFDPPKISNLLSSYFLLTAYLSARKLAIAKKISQLTLVFWLPCAGSRRNVKNFVGISINRHLPCAGPPECQKCWWGQAYVDTFGRKPPKAPGSIQPYSPHDFSTLIYKKRYGRHALIIHSSSLQVRV